MHQTSGAKGEVQLSYEFHESGNSPKDETRRITLKATDPSALSLGWRSRKAMLNGVHEHLRLETQQDRGL
jgi:hypothetical protein